MKIGKLKDWANDDQRAEEKNYPSKNLEISGKTQNVLLLYRA